jgi:hypothetical protein
MRAVSLLSPSLPTGRILPVYTLLGALCLGTFALLSNHDALAQNLDRCPSLPSKQVSNLLATLSMQTGRSIYPRNTQLEVTLTLKAGSNGVYLPAYFGDFMKTCEHGFAAALLTMAGKPADLTEPGCAASSLHAGPGIDSPQAHLPDFIRLEPGETRTWHTTLKTTRLERGHYCLYGEYLSNSYMIDKVAQLPEVNGLMANGKITATPLLIDLR